MRYNTLSNRQERPPMPETLRREKDKVADLLKLIEELRAMKTRLQTLDIQRLEEQPRLAMDSQVKAMEKRARPAGPEEAQKIQMEARRIVDADHERSLEILASKFQKLDAGLLSLQNLLQNLAPQKEAEDRLRAQEEELRKSAEELNVRKKVFAREMEEVERDRKLLQAAEEALSQKTREVDAKLLNLDVVRRAEELDQAKADLDGKLKAYQEAMALLTRERDELNRDFEKQGETRAEIDKEAERVQQERQKLDEEKRAMVDTVAREMAATFEAFVRDMLRPQA
jgi:chromosome segregation ATPase